MVYEQVDPHTAELKGTARAKKKDETYKMLDGLCETYRAQVEAGDPTQDRAEALAVCDVIAVVRLRAPSRGWF